MDNANLPAAPVAGGALLRLQQAIDGGMSPALAIMLDETLFAQAQRIAEIMSQAKGFVPAHCVNNTAVCFAITTRSLVWRLDPFAVAQATYQPVEGGKVAYEAKLVQAIIEQSGRLDGGPKRRYEGDWSKVQAKFQMKTSERGKKYAAPAWAEADEAGLKIFVTAQLKGEREPREIELELRQCHPRNSTLWATDPKTQIYYRAVRMFGNVACPSLLMGVPFVGEEPDDEEARFRRAKDVTARDVSRASAPPADDVILVDPDGEERAYVPGEVEVVVRTWCAECTDEQLATLVENNPESLEIGRAVAAEQAKRARKAASSDDDPLAIAGKTAKQAIAAIETAIHDADAAGADALWRLYRDRVRGISQEVHDKLESVVLDKIQERLV